MRRLRRVWHVLFGCPRPLGHLWLLGGGEVWRCKECHMLFLGLN